MANGDSPIPKMPTGIFNDMKSWIYSDGGYKMTPEGDTFYLHVISDGDGEVKWGLTENVPSWSERCAVGSGNNTILQDCTLDGFVFEDSSSQQYKLHANPGTNVAYLAEI